MAYKVKKDPIDKIPKAQFVFWIIVRISMLVCAGYSFIHGDLVMGFESANIIEKRAARVAAHCPFLR